MTTKKEKTLSKKLTLAEAPKPQTVNEALALTNEERKDMKIIALEITNIQLQMGGLQVRFNELQQSAVAFQTALLKNKELSTDDYALDFNTLEIVKRK